MTISIIVALAGNNGIGKDNGLLWHLPADLRHFRLLTTGHPIIMGRKTYDSIGKPLPNRRNIVITRNTALAIPGVSVVHSLKEALYLCSSTEEVFVIGGAEIYRQALPLCDTLYLTTVAGEFEADTFFPALNGGEWQEEARTEHEADEKNRFPYTFRTLKRR